jgi:hypothetical protein
LSGELPEDCEDGDQQGAESSGFPGSAIEMVRLPLPAPLGLLLGISTHELVVEATISQKIRRDHPGDWLFLERIELFVENWQLAGVSPKGPNRIEVYGQLDEIWLTAVIRAEPIEQCAALVTLHRIYRRKVESRLRRGYLKKRES